MTLDDLLVGMWVAFVTGLWLGYLWGLAAARRRH